MSAELDGGARGDLERRLEAVESGYEFLLAYAAQGRKSDRGSGAGRNVRDFLAAMETALDGLGAVVRRCAEQAGGDVHEVGAAFFDALERDAEVALAAMRVLSSRSDISSQLVDNLNASIHVRAILTDLFIVDEAFKMNPGEARSAASPRS